ncbi:hypothetical protein AX15_001088 [Amanita polypyramis BW_CC]|nr:hypothetical protein AX15_001088 [Amanita polypyramis BW_CC]
MSLPDIVHERPWSPEVFSYPMSARGHQVVRRSREPSDVSVDALDLAGYAQTLHTRQELIDPQDVFSCFPRTLASQSTASKDSLRIPSLISRGNTLSTSTHPLTSSRRQIHRPYSLPDTVCIQGLRSVAQVPHAHGSDSRESEIDISQFPSWSRNWYRSAGKAEYNLDTPPPARISIFDPSYKPILDNDDYPFPSYRNDMFPSHSTQHTSLREYYLPWSPDPLESGAFVSTETKEERVRMLEREFGQNAKPPPRDAFTDENGKPLVGTVDTKGNLITVGPKKRTALRALQILLTLVAAVPSIYAALFIKPQQGTPPPAGKLAAFILYALSIITMVVMLYLHLLRPCCGGRRKRGKPFGDNPILNGMMVLPMQGLPGGKGEKKNKGKKGVSKIPGSDVQVNLIVDPNAFGIGDKSDDDGDDEVWDSDGDSPFPGSGRGRKRRKARRRSLFAGLAMEQEWRRARAWAQKMAVVDVVGSVLWGAAFILILFGKRCPSGGYSGWCNAYNTSSAAACLLCLAFCTSIFFDVKDLFDSKTNPRTRT